MIDEGHLLTDKKLEELEKRIAREYRRANLDVQRKLNEYLMQFAEQDKKQRELLKAGKITQKDYQDFLTRKIAVGKRWQAMRDVLAEDYHNTNVIARNICYDYQKDVYALNHNFATYQIEHDARIDTSYTLYDRATVERILRDDPELFHKPGTKRQRQIAANKDLKWNKQKINSVILQGILQGSRMDEIAKNLSRVTDGNYKAAVRNARTATTGAQSAGRVDGYKRAQDMGIDLEQEWMATIDGKTRHEHRQLHGMRVKVGEPFEVDGVKIRYPGDPQAPGYLIYNCRCTVIGKIKGFETELVTTSPKMGDMSFEEWREAKRKKK